MSSELKWGIMLGVIVAVAAVWYFVQDGKEDEPLGLEEPSAPVSSPVVPHDTTEVVKPEPAVIEQPQPKPAEVTTLTPSVSPAPSANTDIIVAVPAPTTPSTPTPPVQETKPVAAETPASITQEPRYHIVKRGETLTEISELYYGEGRFWKVIRDANKTLITNENVVKEGWKLKIPYPGEVAGLTR